MVGFAASIDQKWPTTSPMLVFLESSDPVDILGWVASRERGPKPISKIGRSGPSIIDECDDRDPFKIGLFLEIVSKLIETI